jgi:hypothetical protein
MKQQERRSCPRHRIAGRITRQMSHNHRNNWTIWTSESFNDLYSHGVKLHVHVQNLSLTLVVQLIYFHIQRIRFSVRFMFLMFLSLGSSCSGKVIEESNKNRKERRMTKKVWACPSEIRNIHTKQMTKKRLLQTKTIINLSYSTRNFILYTFLWELVLVISSNCASLPPHISNCQLQPCITKRKHLTTRQVRAFHFHVHLLILFFPFSRIESEKADTKQTNSTKEQRHGNQIQKAHSALNHLAAKIRTLGTTVWDQNLTSIRSNNMEQ